MNINATMPAVRAADLTMEQVSTSSVVSDQEKVAELARQFEAVLLRQILREARAPMNEATLEGSSSATRAYDDMVTERLADTISRDGSFGLGNSLQAQLLRQLPGRSGPATAEGGPLP